MHRQFLSKFEIWHKKENYFAYIGLNNEESIKFCEGLGFTLKEKRQDRYIYVKSLDRNGESQKLN